MPKQLVVLQEIHEDLEDSLESPYISEMEAYYLLHPSRFSAKIGMATWIPVNIRRHMVNHVRQILIQRARVRAGKKAKAKVFGFEAFVKTGVEHFRTDRFSFGRKRNGQVFKQDRRTGRFAAFTREERGVLERQKQKR